MALSWVHSNIEAFDGDASKITIFGESAGAISVKQLIAQPPEPLPFRAAILESETNLPADISVGFWELLVAEVGCETDLDQLGCMRNVSADKLRTAAEQGSFLFTPVANSVNLRDVRPAFESGAAAKVPIMLGSNKDEGNGEHQT